MMDDRVFDGLLERVGGNGRYQTLALYVWSLLAFSIGSTNFFLPYVYYQGKYNCPVSQSNCKEFVCSLPPNQRAQYTNDDLFSLASKFGDYRCQGSAELDRLQSFIYLGGALGVLFGAFFIKVLTKRKLLILAVLVSIIGLVTAVLGQSLLIASIGLFLNSAAAAIQMEMLQCYIVETVSEEGRGQHLNIVFILFSFGVTLNGLFFYLLKSWQSYVLIIISILFSILLMLKYYIEETPFDAITCSTPEESFIVLAKIGEWNSIQSEHNITLPQLENIKRQFLENQQQNQHSSISIFDLFKFDSLRMLTIVSLLLHYVTFFQFSVPELAITDYSLNIYINGIVIGFGELMGCIVSYLIIDNFQRRKVIFLTQIVCMATSVVVFYLFSCPDKTCPIKTQIIQTIGLTFFKFCATVSYNFFVMLQFEAFPNQIRGLAIQFVSIPSYLATVNLPQIIALCENSRISVVFTFILCSLIIVIFNTCLPQTFGVPLPEIIEELKYEHHALQDPVAQEKMKDT